MDRTLRKPLWRWEPGPYLLLVLLVLVTGSLRPDRFPVAYWILFAITVAVAAVLVAVFVLRLVRGPRNPDAAGMLVTLDGLDLVHLEPSDAPPTPVIGTQRHQEALYTVHARVGSSPVAVLVPDATRWLGRRIRIAVHLIAAGRVHHVGFLSDISTGRYNAGLHALAQQRRFVTAGATIVGEERPFTLQLDLGALTGVADAAQASTAQAG
jgi:hypothetical protein